MAIGGRSAPTYKMGKKQIGRSLIELITGVSPKNLEIFEAKFAEDRKSEIQHEIRRLSLEWDSSIADDHSLCYMICSPHVSL